MCKHIRGLVNIVEVNLKSEEFLRPESDWLVNCLPGHAWFPRVTYGTHRKQALRRFTVHCVHDLL